MAFRSLGTLRDFLAGVNWPLDIIQPDDIPALLDNIHVLDYETSDSGDVRSGTVWLAMARELSLSLPGLSDIALQAGSDTAGYTFLTAAYRLDDKLTVSIQDVALTLRVGARLLKPMRKTSAGRFEPDTSRSHTQFNLGTMTVTADSTGDVSFDQNFDLQLPHPVQLGESGPVVESGNIHLSLTGERRGLAVRWTEEKLNQWLRDISPALANESTPGNTQMTARILFDHDGLQEARVDWTMTPAGEWALPGVKLQTPAALPFTLLFGGAGRDMSEMALAVSLPASQTTRLESTFAWGRDEERELQSNRATPDPFVTVELKNSAALSVAVLDLDLAFDGLPGFFRQFETPLAPLDFNQPDTLFEPTAVTLRGLNGNEWDGTVILDEDAFRMPFLEQDGDNPQANQFEQWLDMKPRSEPPGGQPADVQPLANPTFKINFDKAEVELPFDVTVKFGSIALTGDLTFAFNWEKMSLSVNHGSGISIASKEPSYSPEDAHLGLYWTLRGAPIEGSDRFEYFRVATKDYNYQIQMAEGAAFEVEYREISDEPILFIISDFVLSPNGIGLTAEVSDRPARLNGIDTRFRFSGSRLEIVENSIKDLTLAGSGPLPPDLVGEAMVDVALQFKQVNGSLTLVAGSAQLQANKLLECKGTRFQFAVDAIGLKFVLENRFHLYFTLTGSAQFVLAAGDDSEGALALLPKIKIDMVECPLCGDVSVLAKHIKFLIELPKPLKFSFLKAFDFELRGFGFQPQTEVLGGIGSMLLSGQILFSQGGGDIIEAKVDFHNLYIGLPKKGQFVPQIYFKRIAVQLKVGEAFELYGAVEFYDEGTIKGFAGEGMVDLKGMPQVAAAFSFVRVRRDENANWVRAWFIYLEVRKVSFMIPVVQLYIREIGLGFGYRYTVASIKAVDKENDIKKLRAELVKLSRTQAELAKVSSWAVDLEDPGQDPRWTIVFRAMIAQNSASPGALQYTDSAEEVLPSLFLLDAMIAFRSDLTFYMAVRGWLNTNYHEFLKGGAAVREKPLYSGFVLLSPRRKLFMMAVASNPDGFIGDHPPLPDFVKEAIRSVTFSATLIITPGLLHFELGWPNKLGWKLDLGILKVDVRGGFIFRVTPEEMVIGISQEARGKLDIKAELDLGLVGVWVRATVEVGFGARVIAVLPFKRPQDTIMYGAIGLELMIRLEFGFWIKIPMGFFDIKIKFSFSLEIGFTAGLELALGVPPQVVFGLRGQGTLWIAVMGHRLQVSANLSIRDEVVQAAVDRTKHVLDMGMEATDSTELPGFGGAGLESLSFALAAAEVEPLAFHLPGYSVFVMRSRDPDQWGCFALFPRGEQWDGDKLTIEQGFLPPPPLALAFNVETDWLDAGKLSPALQGEIEARAALSLLGRVSIQVVTPGAGWWMAGRWLTLDEEHPGVSRRQYRLALEEDRLVFYAIHNGVYQNHTVIARYTAELDSNTLSPELLDLLNGWTVTPVQSITTVKQGSEWVVTTQGSARFILRQERGRLLTIFTVAFETPVLTLAALDSGEAPAVLTDALAAQGVGLTGAVVVATPDADGEWRLTGTAADGTARAFQLRRRAATSQLELLQEVTADFTLALPTADDLTLRQFDPLTRTWQTRDAGQSFSWAADWQAPAFTGQLHPNDANGQPTQASQTYEMNLAAYLSQAYVHAPFESPPLVSQSGPAGDPNTDLFTSDRAVQEDGRVYNPTDNAFEAAVRGAAEQFAGSPYFRLDTSNPYDYLLQQAFLNGTTIYNDDGQLNDAGGVPLPDKRAKADANRTVMQARGVVIQGIVDDLRAYAAHLARRGPGEDGAPPPPAGALAAATSIPFNMGLIFAYKGDTPAWLDSFDVAGEALPTIRQRLSPTAVTPDETVEATVETFNLRSNDFAVNPPLFSRIQHYTSSNTIAITWDLTWGDTQATGTPRDEPDHHLAHYEVRRRALNGREREVVTTVKPAEALHREGVGSTLRRLRPRFNVVDNFNRETPEEQAAMPPEGVSYLYTITPVDFTGQSGRPLTLVATRYPSQPPFVPANARLVMTYEQQELPGDIFADATSPLVTRPGLRPAVVAPSAVELRGWAEGSDTRRGAQEPAARYYLLFRKEQTLPIGSYGLDAATAVERIAARPVSHARPLPTDVRVEVTDIQDNPVALGAALRGAGVLPAAEWRPEAWTVFIQTQSLKGVYSALVPVELIMRVATELPDDRTVSDERQLAMLEWLAEPLRFPYLPPEDQTARTGPAHFPMPGSATAFDGTLDGARYRPHPAGLRAIRFRWNQAPSASPDYPLNLNAGYHLYQLDVDAHTDAVMESAPDRMRALRRLQEVQMIPAEDLPFVPGDTLTVNQWEAWYPSAVCRQEDAHTVETSSGEQQTRSPWYSWRESQLVWPPCPPDFVADVKETSGAERFTRQKVLHPVLQGIIDNLRETFNVEVQLYPPDVPADLATLLRVTAPKNDAYGWGVLQRFGLAVTIALREPQNGNPVLGDELLVAVAQRLADNDLVRDEHLPHLYVEVLFQAAGATSLKEDAVQAGTMLAILQLSLRPRLRQTQSYRKVLVRGKPGEPVTVGLCIAKDKAVSLRDLSQDSAGQIEVEGDAPDPFKLWRQSFKLPLNGELALAVRGAALPDVLVPLTKAEYDTLAPANVPLPWLAGFGVTPLANKAGPAATAWFLVLTKTIDNAGGFRQQLGDGLAAVADKALAIRIESFSPQALEADGFAVSEAMERAMLADPDNQLDWKNFRRYAESLSGPETPRITVPTGGDTFKEFLPAYLDWTARFFDHSGGLTPGAGGLAQTADGPWLATAYPRVATPAYAAPDAGGRLKYDHLIEDKWAHNYRHFILPYGRYDLLWRSIWQSPTFAARRAPMVLDGDLSPEERRMPELFADVTMVGGLDVVLERTRPVDRPLILRSGRLDRAVVPGRPAPPGAMWEVIIARHTEQAMVERNQTLARQVAFRQVSFTLLRRFAYPTWRETLVAMVTMPEGETFALDVRPVATYDEYDAAALPDAYPAQPDHLALGAGPLSETDGLSLDLPQRLASFQQGALVLQWQALPFYYHHKLLVIAQSASTVSPVNELVQRDFEYRSPAPIDEASMRLHDPGILRVRIPLNMLWESLPPEAQELWASEAPNAPDSAETSRKYAALPDPEVVYQVLVTFNGNVEVQVEYLYEETPAGRGYVARQLGKEIIAKANGISLPPPLSPLGRFFLVVDMKCKIAGDYLPIEDVVWQRADLPEIDLLPFRWPAADRWVLVWEGELDDRQREDLLALPGDRAFLDAVGQVVEQAADAQRPRPIRVPVALPPEPLPGNLPQRHQLERDEETGRYTGLTRSAGPPPDDEEKAALRDWAGRTRELAEAVAELLSQITPDSEESITVPLDIALRPTQGGLPESLAASLLLGRRPIVAVSPISDTELPGWDEFFEFAPEHAALRRLATHSIAGVLKGRRLELRTRRGSATPSARLPISSGVQGE